MASTTKRDVSCQTRCTKLFSLWDNIIQVDNWDGVRNAVKLNCSTVNFEFGSLRVVAKGKCGCCLWKLQAEGGNKPVRAGNKHFSEKQCIVYTEIDNGVRMKH